MMTQAADQNHREARAEGPSLVREQAGFPSLYEAERGSDERELLRFVERHAEELRQRVHQAGALLLRGFSLRDTDTFRAVAERVVGPLDGGYRGPSPRKQLAQGIYTASEVGGSLVIPEHAELSYMETMPRYVLFWCREPAPVGGETTLVDGRRVLARLDPEQVRPLLEGRLHIRRRHAPARALRDPFELTPWPRVFGEVARESLLRELREHGIAASFERSGALTLRQSQPAVRSHPVTGEPAWLNHLLVFHASAPAALLHSAYERERALAAYLLRPLALGYRALARRFGYELASDVRLADERAIPDALVQHVREAVDREAYAHAWQRVRLGAGRQPLGPPRQASIPRPAQRGGGLVRSARLSAP